ncbi:MAG: endonuclease I [Candidatus Dadabacteria bacterium]|nr:endonuclease I [Candidatus Dadabacteria bacterium]
MCFVGLVASNAYSRPLGEYYLAAEGKTGDALKSALHKIIDNHYVLPYTWLGNDNWHDGKNIDVWESLIYTDSSCPDANPRCGRVHLLYLNEDRSIAQANRGEGENDSWDREHVWPKSRGFPKKSQDGYTDLHHLRPADRNINRKRSNYGYNMGGRTVMDKLSDGREVPTAAKIDADGNSFEPPDLAKGQVARMIFYMAVRYEGDPDENMPDLVLRNENNKVSEPWIGNLCTLLEWNNRFAPTEFERRRNKRVMELQGNRNPFIEEPNWANLIWYHRCK